MEDYSIEYLSDVSSVCERKANENENKCLQNFLNILEIEDCKLKRSLTYEESCPLLLRDAATQTETELVNIPPPWVVYLENKTNTICRELSGLLKSIARSNDCERDQQNACISSFNWNHEANEEQCNIRTAHQIEEKIEASLKMVLELKNTISIQSIKEKCSQTSFSTVDEGPSLKGVSRKDPAKKLNFLRVSPSAIYMDEVFPRSLKISQMPFEIFNDQALKSPQRARAVVAPTRSGAGLTSNPTERLEGGKIYCSTPKNPVQMKTRESLASNQLQQKKLQKTHLPVLKGEPSRATQRSSSKKQRNQNNPPKPPWR